MPNIRCKWYDDNGTAIRAGGCGRGTCTFVHPSQPNWKHAQRAAAPYRGKGRGGRERSEWDTKGWGAGPSTGYEAVYYEKSSTGWSDRRASIDNQQGERQASTSINTDSGWGDGWGSTNVGGWGSNNNESTRSWGNSNVSSSSWGNNNGSSSGDNNNDGSGWGDGSAAEWGSNSNAQATAVVSVEDTGNKGGQYLGKRSTDSEAGQSSGKGLQATNDNHQDVQSRSILGEGQTAAETTYTQGNNTGTQIQETPPVPSSLLPESPVVSWADPPTTIAATETAQSAMAPDHTRSSKPKPDMSKPSFVAFAHAKGLPILVRYQIELDKSIEEYERWKRTQMSNNYARASPATRHKLDGQRAVYSQKSREIRTRLRHLTTEAVAFPEARSTTQPRRVDFAAIEQRIRDYTTELEEWEAEAKRYSELAYAAQIARTTAEAQTVKSEKELTNAEQWEQLKSLVASLDERVEIASELLYSQRFTSLMDLEDHFTSFQERHTQPDPTVSVRVSNLGDGLNQPNKSLEKQVDVTAKLLDKISANEALIAKLKAERDASKELEAKIESEFAQFEEWQQEDEAEIARLTEQVATLHIHQEQQVLEGTKKLVLQEVDAMVRNTVIETLVRDVGRILEAYRSECRDYQTKVAAQLEEQMGPVLDEMKSIYARAQAALQQGQLSA